jgi:hypothetical protein
MVKVSSNWRGIPEEYRNQIVTGDARELVKWIPDESIDLIFTDPVYDQMDDYSWLSEAAQRILREDSAALIWCGIGYLPQVISAVIQGGLSYKWQLIACRPTGFKSRFCQKNLFSNYQSLLWFEKGKSFPKLAASDLIFSNDGGRMYHQTWGKNVSPFKHWLYRFVDDGAVVFDPFTGGGTVPAVCKMLGRRYIAFEIDPSIASIARKRVEETQPPLLVPEARQLEFDEERVG